MDLFGIENLASFNVLIVLQAVLEFDNLLYLSIAALIVVDNIQSRCQRRLAAQRRAHSQRVVA